MSAFRYEAARADGALVRGCIEAATVPDATGILSGRGLFPVSIEVERDSSPRRLGARAEAVILETLGAFLEAGVSLQQTVAAAERSAAGQVKAIMGRVGRRVREGAPLSAALAEERGAFSGITIGLVRAGEAGVGLGPALEQAVAHLERESAAATRVRAALAYPLILAAVGTVSVFAITLFIVPRFAALLGDLGQSLPFATRLLVLGSDVGRVYGPFSPILGVAVVIAGRVLIRQHRTAWHRWLLSLPLIGAIRHRLAGARACRTLAALLGSGTPALRALDAAREAAGDAAIEERILAVKTTVAEGRALASAIEAAGLLTPNAQELVAIGDQSGRLPRMLTKAAEIQEREAEHRVRSLVAILEPALILVFAGLVAFVAAALLQAIYAVRPA